MSTTERLLVIDDVNFDAEVLASPRPFLLAFGGAWCGPCRQLTPVLERLAGTYGGQYRVGKIDIDDSPLTGARFSVRAVPTLLVFKAGAVVNRRVGTLNEVGLLKLVG